MGKRKLGRPCDISKNTDSPSVADNLPSMSICNNVYALYRVTRG